MATEFDACEWIAGFPLLSIQKALVWVGLTNDRIAQSYFRKALGCGPRQAEGVLDELERLGFVRKEAGEGKLSRTEKGHRLVSDWKPPRKLRPMIHRDDTASPGNRGLEDVRCLLFSATDADDEVFEEAWLQANFWTEYEGDHLIEVSVFKPDPDNTDDPPSSGTTTESAYLSPANARAIAAALQKAADMADAEIARRARHPPKPRPPDPNESFSKAQRGKPRKGAPSSKESMLPTDKERPRKARSAVATTVAELRGEAISQGRHPRKR